MDFLNNIPIQTTTGFIGLGLLVFGGFMVLAGLDIISIEKISVNQGKRTWIVGLVFAILGLALLFPEFGLSLSWSKQAAEQDGEQSPLGDEQAALPELEFFFDKATHWEETSPGIFTVAGSDDTFAWSKEVFQGDLQLKIDLTSYQPDAEGCIIFFGNGQGYTEGSLLFCINVDGYYLEKNSVYHDGENYLAHTFTPVKMENKVYSLTIIIEGNFASLQVNGEEVFAVVFDQEEINSSGRIGLLKKWYNPEITFSNLELTRP